MSAVSGTGDPVIAGPYRGMTLAPSRDRLSWSEPPTPFAMRIHGVSISRRQAVPMALILTLLASLGDAWTTAEAAFTLFYLAPIGVAVWFHGRRFGYVIVALCSAGSVVTDLLTRTRPLSPLFLVWNNGIELGLFVVFLWLLDALRSRLEREIHRPGSRRPDSRQDRLRRRDDLLGVPPPRMIAGAVRSPCRRCCRGGSWRATPARTAP